MAKAPQRIVLQHLHALGDTVCMSALIRDLALAHPGRFEVGVQTHYKSVWYNNPYCEKVENNNFKGAQTYVLSYKEGITHSGRGNKIHFLTWFHEDFRRKTGIHVPITAPKGDLHFAGTDNSPLISGRYWLLFAGGKKDVALKHWDYEKFQEVVDLLTDEGIAIVQGGAADTGNVQPALRGVLDMVGKTADARDLFNLVRFAEGVICPVTGPMHLAGALEKPCVVVAGGREEWWWEAYVNLPGVKNFHEATGKVKVPHRFLHTIGQLDCCAQKGCWRLYPVPIDRKHLDANNQRSYQCKQVVRLDSGQAIGRCMDMITAEHVKDAVMSYYADGTIPPIQPRKDSVIVKPATLFIPPLLDEPLEVFKAPAITIAGSPTPVLPELVRDPIRIQPVGIQHRTPYQEMTGVKGSIPPAVGRHALDHPVIGGKVTVFVLCYGKGPDCEPLAPRCLDSILSSVPRDRIDLRVIANACSETTLRYLRKLKLDRLYVHQENMLKYPAMRLAFWDEHHPITTSQVIWFDDDSYVADVNWLTALCQAIINNHSSGGRLFGIKFRHDLTLPSLTKGGHKPAEWFKQADWWSRKKGFLGLKGQESPNGSNIFFVSGGFWAAGIDAIRMAQIPDKRLRHRGGDITIGHQVYHAGFKVCMFNEKKRYVFSSGAKRRGHNEAYPWSPPGSPPAP